MRSVAIHCWEFLVLAKTWLECVSNVSIDLSSVGGVSGVLVDLVFFPICFVCTFAVSMEGGKCFMRYTVMLENVVKWPFLMAWSNVFLTGMNSVVWYHLSRSGFHLASRSLSAIFSSG